MTQGADISSTGGFVWSPAQKFLNWEGHSRCAFSFAAMSFESFSHVPVTEELLRHVWDGEEDQTKGGHRFGSGREGKTEFPEHWDISMAESSIRSVLRQPQSIRRNKNHIKLFGVYGEVIIGVKITILNGVVWIDAAFPVCGDGVFRITKGIPQELPLDISMLEA
jgi:hypothetical protein